KVVELGYTQEMSPVSKVKIKPKRPYRKYDREFKLEAVKLVMERDLPQTKVAKDLGISLGVLRDWIEVYRRDQESAFPGKGRLKPHEQRVKDLEQELKRVRMERDILKKAM